PAKSGVSVYAGAQQVTISGNTVAGHTDAEIRIDSGHDHVVRENTVTASTPTPAGVAVRVAKADTTTIEGNTIAGHAQAEGVLDGGAGHVVRANRIGTANGTDGGSHVGVLVGGARQVTIGGAGGPDGNLIAANVDAGVRVSAVAVDVTISQNRI